MLRTNARHHSRTSWRAESRSTDRRGWDDIRPSRARKIGGDSRVGGPRWPERDGILPEERAVSRRQGGAERRDGPRWAMADDIGSSCGVATRAEGVCRRAGSMQHYEHFPSACLQSTDSGRSEACYLHQQQDAGRQLQQRQARWCHRSQAAGSTVLRQRCLAQYRLAADSGASKTSEVASDVRMPMLNVESST